jgi:predicted nucleotidyltransferase
MTIKRQKQWIGKEGIVATNVKMKVMNKEGVRPRVYVSTRQRIMWRRGKGGRRGVFTYIRRWTWHTRRELLQQIEKWQIKRGEIKVAKMKMMKINKKLTEHKNNEHQCKCLHLQSQWKHKL